MAVCNSQENQKGNSMHHDTIALLQECSSGCKMAIESMERIRTQVTDGQLAQLINKYYDPHIKLETECRELLMTAGEPDKEPNIMARTSAMMQSAIKMARNDDTSQAAKILTEGCNMGIKSICRYLNQYSSAMESIKSLCYDLVEIEENFAKDLRKFL